MANCKAIKANGENCGGFAVAGSEFCFTHDPTRARERAEARKKGGAHNRPNHGGDAESVPLKVRSLEDVLCLLDYTLAETLVQANSNARSRLLVTLAGAYIQAIQVGEMEQRLETLEGLVYGQSANSDSRAAYSLASRTGASFGR